MWPRIVTDASPHTMKPEGRACVSWANALRKMTLTRSTLYHSHKDTIYSQQRTISLSSRLFHDTRVAVVDISGSLARSTRDLVPSTSRRFTMVLGDTAGATCARIFSLDAVQAVTAAHTILSSCRASVLCGRPELGLRVCECCTDHCWKQGHTTTLCPTFAENHGCSLEWLLGTLFTSQYTTVTASSQNGGRNDRPPERHRSPVTVTNESLTLQPLSMHILYPGANEHSSWWCGIFCSRVLLN